MTFLAWPTPPRTFVAVVMLLALLPARAGAQNPADARAYDAPAHVAFVDGEVVLERDGTIESSPASMPLLAGDRLRTQGGRVEVLFADGATLHLDANTVVDFQSDEVMRLLEGRVRLNIPGPPRDIAYRIDAPGGWIQITEPGEFRVSLLGSSRDAELELAVLRGAAELVNEEGRTPLRAGERAFARAGAAPSYAYVFNSAAWDAFDRWSEARRNERLGAYAEYLPAEVRPYGATLARYGTWRHEPTYGYVWYPTVRAGWRPYFQGRWTTLRPYGWTWIGYDPWAWPTHHYGRWGFSAGVWFWIPGRHWGPAWVSWAYAPGYVSWCPLGWNNRPVFSFVHINIFGGRRYDPWYGWTVVPHRRFAGGLVHANVVNITHIDLRTRNSFVIREAAPEIRGYAIPRAEAPIRVAGTRGGMAVPRAGSIGPGASGTAESRRDAAAAAHVFRSRRAAPEASRGQGFPAPAREPRAASPLRQAAPRERGAPARSPESAAAPVDRRPGPATGEVDRGAARRAIPRSAPDAVPSPSGPPASPSRAAAPGTGRPAGEPRATPRYERRPSSDPPSVPRDDRRAAPGSGSDVPSRAPAPVRRRSLEPASPPPARVDAPGAVPRGAPPPVEYYRGSRRDSEPAARPERHAPPEFRRAPSPERVPSGAVRPAPARPSGEGPAFRGPAVERRAPGPPPSAGIGRSAPAASSPRPGGPPASTAPPSRSAPDGGGASRSRGAQPPSGSARPRGREG